MTGFTQRFWEKFFGIPRDQLRYRLTCRSCRTRFQIDRMPKFCPECGEEVATVIARGEWPASSPV
jgi:rRNA maturation endonuclease Nob1